jgi:transposase
VAFTMTWVGLDVHARSVEASVVDSTSGELSRRRVSASEIGPVVDWLRSLPGPVRACYEAGPTGYGLARAAREVGISMEVVAPSKTPRMPGDRIRAIGATRSCLSASCSSWEALFIRVSLDA